MKNIFVMLIVQTIGIIIKGNLKVRYCNESFNMYCICVSIVFHYVFVVIRLSVGCGVFDTFQDSKSKQLGLNGHRKHNWRFYNNISEMVKIRDRNSFIHE